MMGCVIAVQIAADTDWNTFLQKEKRTLRECSFSFGRGIRIRTLNNGVRAVETTEKYVLFKPFFNSQCLPNVCDSLNYNNYETIQ